jgi:spore maturation protein SpmB
MPGHRKNRFIPWKKVFTSTMVSFSYLMSGSVSSEGERNVLGAIGLLYTICQVCTPYYGAVTVQKVVKYFSVLYND